MGDGLLLQNLFTPLKDEEQKWPKSWADLSLSGRCGGQRCLVLR